MKDVPPQERQGRSGDRRAILAILDEFLSRGGVARVIPLLDRPPPPNDDALYLDEYCRVRFVIEGELRLQTPGFEERVVDVTMTPGDALYSVPGGWSLRPHPSQRRMISITFMPEYIRYVITNRRFDTPRGHAVQHWRHTSAPAGAETVLVNQALNACVRNGGDPETMLHLTKALIRQLRRALADDRGGKQGKAHVTWQLLREYVEEYYHLPIDRNSVAAEFGLAPDYVSRLFRQEGNEGFTRYLTRLRMQRALSLVEESRLRISQIAERCGFSTESYFIKAFRKAYGSSPGRLRSAER